MAPTIVPDYPAPHHYVTAIWHDDGIDGMAAACRCGAIVDLPSWQAHRHAPIYDHAAATRAWQDTDE